LPYVRRRRARPGLRGRWGEGCSQWIVIGEGSLVQDQRFCRRERSEAISFRRQPFADSRSLSASVDVEPARGGAECRRGLSGRCVVELRRGRTPFFQEAQGPGLMAIGWHPRDAPGPRPGFFRVVLILIGAVPCGRDTDHPDCRKPLAPGPCRQLSLLEGRSQSHRTTTTLC
jgi:hypothetical protein